MADAAAEQRRGSPTALRSFMEACLVRVGARAEDAAIVADNLLHASLRGVDSHGVSRLPIYCERIEKGLINREARPRIVAESPSTALVDADNGLGAVAGTFAMQECIRRARLVGSAWVGVRHSNHFGTCAYYALQGAEAGLFALATTNAPATMAPWGSVTPYQGTNPLALAAPCDPEPVVLDMATSVTARGYLILAAAEGREIPLGWAQDRWGRPTTDPKAGLEGSVLPVGGPKGYALAFMIDVLCGILTGSAFGPHIGELYDNDVRPQDVGHVVACVDVSRFVPLETFKAALKQMSAEVRSCALAEGATRIYVPGEVELEKRTARERDGIPLPAATVRALESLGARLGVPFDV